jgi:hypothetical protein
VLEVVYDALAVQEVHGRCQPVPIQGLGKAQPPGATRDIGNGDDLLERHDLHGGDNANDVDVAHEHGAKEAANHDKRPYRPSDEGLFLLLIVGHGGRLSQAH